MKKLLSILSILALSFASISCSSDEKTQSEETAIKPELYAIGTTPVNRSVISKQYLFTLDNIKSFNSKTREMVFVNFEPNSSKNRNMYAQQSIASYHYVCIRSQQPTVYRPVFGL